MRGLGLKVKLLLCILPMIIIFPGYTVASDCEFDFSDVNDKQYVYDYADEYTDKEEKALQKKCEKIGKKLDLDIIVVTTNDLGFPNRAVSDGTIDLYESQFAEALYLSGGFEDGILYLLDLQYDGIYVIRSGMGEVYIDDGDREDILDAIWEDFEGYSYYDAAVSFINKVDDIVGVRIKDESFIKLKEAWEDGGYVYYDDFLADYREEIIEAHEEHLFTPFKKFANCLLVGAIIGGIAVAIIVYTSSTRMIVGNKTYMKQGSFKMLHRFDRYTHTTSHSYKVQTSSSGGGGSSGGISSSHRSSFGGSSRSFSGGGRRR